MTSAVELTTPEACPRCEGEGYRTLYRGADRLYRTTTRNFSVIECSSCGLMRLDPFPTQEELRSFYPENYWWEHDDSAVNRLAEMYRRVVMGDHVRFARAAVEADGRLLDVGCGGGSFLAAMVEHGVDCFGSDFSAKAAAQCLRHAEAPAVCAQLPRLPFQPHSFQTVTMFHVLEHLPDPVSAVEAVAELLPPGGRFIVQTPNASCWQLLLLGDRWNGLDVPRHLINFRSEDLEELLEGCGFDVLRRKYFSLRDNPAGLAASLCPDLEPVARRMRGVSESPQKQALKSALFFALTVAAVPFTLLEAAGAAGSTIMIDAVRRGRR
ncbi:MAG: methyltransferase domain-containing protein [Acidobacteria bacterium]|nr:methyltransferase domain-containing protein [Acidobacteriota bacterium]